MRWEGREQSENVEDRSGMSPMLPVAGGGIGLVIVALLVSLLGGDPSSVLQGAQQMNPGAGQEQGSGESTADPKRKEFVAVVLKDTEDVWTAIFKQYGRQYRNPKLVLFAGQVQSACGSASAAMGPFYCGEDEKVYIDLSFYDLLKQRFGAPGEFAQAYVVAHEVGHHVQKLLGTMDKVNEARSRMNERDANQLSVRLELQADYYAGMWARRANEMKGILDAADIDDALTAANAIGDDTLQRQAQGTVVPDSFTHGSSAQRVKWFKKGWQNGTLEGGDTFSADNL